MDDGHWDVYVADSSVCYRDTHITLQYSDAENRGRQEVMYQLHEDGIVTRTLYGDAWEKRQSAERTSSGMVIIHEAPVRRRVGFDEICDLAEFVTRLATPPATRLAS